MKTAFCSRALPAIVLFALPYTAITQNVGIGTSFPSALLHTNGTSLGGGNVVFAGAVKLFNSTTPPVTGAGTRLMWFPDKSAFRVGHLAAGQASYWDGENIGYYSTAMGEATMAKGKGSIALGTASLATGEGAVAMGTNLNANGSNATAMGFNNTANGYASLVIGRYADSIVAPQTGQGPNTPLFIIGNGSNTNNRNNALVVWNLSRVGIGTNNPLYELSFRQDNLGIGTPATDNLAIYTAGNERMRLTANGAVGIGTSSPATLLEVRSSSAPTIRIANNTSGSVRLDFERAGTGDAGGFDWRVQNESGLLVFSRSVDDLATVTNLYQFSNARFRPVPDNTLSLGASDGRWNIIYATNGVINTSDARLKNHISPLAYGLEAVLHMNPVSFRWKDEPDAGTNLGFLAQEMQALIPETIHDPGNGNPLGMRYSELIPVLVKAIQEMKAEINAYRSRIDALEASIKK